FIFFEKSPRNIDHPAAARLRRAATGRAVAVAVTVDADTARLDEIVSAMKPDMLQLHGHESVARVGEIKARYGLPILKALALREQGDLAQIEPYIGIADRFLFDAKAPAGSQLPGGNGIAFDWRVLSTLDGSVDYMLSGGLNAGNIAQALEATRAGGVDVSSGVESAPGLKDVKLIEEFFRAVRAAQGTGVA
ncbi:MAG: phosphoribosylanthranilate isomerase, partial [Phyllobacterium sp.]